MYGEGKQTRSFCFVDDLVDGLMKLMNQTSTIGPVNIGNPGEFTIKQAAPALLPHASPLLPRTPLPSSPLPLSPPLLLCPCLPSLLLTVASLLPAAGRARDQAHRLQLEDRAPPAPRRRPAAAKARHYQGKPLPRHSRHTPYTSPTLPRPSRPFLDLPPTSPSIACGPVAGRPALGYPRSPEMPEAGG